jgi:hypothetical protein
MKAVRIILGLILSFAIIKSCNDLGEEEPKSSTIYTVLSLVFLLIPAYLFYSVTIGVNKKNEQKNESIEKNKKNEIDKFNK